METPILNQSCDVKPKPVLSKADFVRRYQQGEFGNRAPTWDSYLDLIGCPNWLNKPGQLFHVRNRIAGAETWYNVSKNELWPVWNNAAQKYGQSNLYISAMAPTHMTTMQGEVQRSTRYLDLIYSRVKKPMRDALAEQSHKISGALALQMLLFYMEPKSWDWMRHLLYAYDDHVIEFSCYDVHWGTISGYNTVFWEVRCGY